MEHRTYPWLQLIFKEIEDSAVAGTTEKQLKTFISTLPKSVDKAYENILNKSKEPDIARKFLLCVLIARKPLTVRDLNVAFWVWHDCTSYSTLDLEPGDSFISTLKQICGHFVIVRNDRVHLIHQTAREILIGLENSRLGSKPSKVWQHSIVFEEAEATLAHTCISVLCFEDFLEEPPYTFPTLESLYRRVSTNQYPEWFDDRPFFCYCSTFWVSHYNNSAKVARQSMHEAIRRCCNPELIYFLNWAPLSMEVLDPGMHSSLFQVCSACGIDSLVRELLNEISDNKARKTVCDDGLLIAASNSRIDTMALLIERGADVDARDDEGNPALRDAVLGSSEGAKFLLEYGANANAHRIGGQSPLCLASGSDYMEMVELLLAHNADVNTVSSQWGSPLFAAASAGHKDVCRLLFEKGARLRKDDWAAYVVWRTFRKDAPTDELDTIYELVKDQEPEEYIRILIETLSSYHIRQDTGLKEKGPT